MSFFHWEFCSFLCLPKVHYWKKRSANLLTALFNLFVLIIYSPYLYFRVSIVENVFNLSFHISDNLMVHTLCYCFHSSAYKTSISVDKVYYLLVVFSILVAYPTTLHHLQSIWEKKDWFSGLGEDWRICRHILASMSPYSRKYVVIFSWKWHHIFVYLPLKT